ncbi:MAG: LLM class flavin-dependent oxidoreductase [Nitrospinota bacterium]
MKYGLTFMAVDPPDQFTDMVRFADASGYDFMWVCDSSLHARYVYCYLTLLATNSEKLLLGPNCTHPHTRHPAINYNALCTLDELSGGRAIMNLGAGDRPVMELGFRMAKLQTVREMVEVGRKLLEGEVLNFEGQSSNFHEAKICYAARASLPIYLTVTNQRMCELAGELADGVLLACGSAPENLEFALSCVKKGAERAGRSMEDIDVACLLYTSVRDSRKDAREDTRIIAAWFPQTAPKYVEIAGFDPGLAERVKAAYSGGHFHEALEAAKVLPEEFVDKFTLSGPPEYCVERVNELRSLGFTHFEVFPVGGDRHLTARRFANEVIPKLS